jgi:succinate-semialdehyde dehydrogenase/glutarate-semialdehyde dehydrogenase
MQSIADRFISRFINCAKGLKIGDPMDENTDIAPLVRAEQVARIDEQVNDSISKGATILHKS